MRSNMGCYMGDLLYTLMTSSYIWRLRLPSFIPWPLGNSKRIYACGESTRTQKILESPLHAPGTQVLIEVWKDGSPKGSAPAHMEGLLCYNTFYPGSSQDTKAWLLGSLLTSQAVEGNRRGHWIQLWGPGNLRYLLRSMNECHSNDHPQNQVSGDKISQDNCKEPTQLGWGCTPK